MMRSGWQLRKLSGPAAEPITKAQAKAQCRVDDDIVEDDQWFAEAITEARAYIEDQLKSTLVETRYLLHMAEWPCALFGTSDYGAVELPFGPIIEIAGVSYLDTDGARQAMAADAFRLVKNGTTGYAAPAYGTSWPWARNTPGSIEIEYTAGYESDGSPQGPGAVPPPVVRGVKMLVAHWYQNRETVLTGTVSKDIEKGLDAVIGFYRNLP